MFNIFDVVSIILILSCAYFGFSTGIIASVFYVSSGYAGMWVAHKFSAQWGMNFYLVFILAAAGVVLIGFILGKVLKGLLLGGFDKFGGLVFGIALGVSIFSVGLYPMIGKLPAKWQDKAYSSFSSAKVMPYMRKLLPEISEFSIQTVKESLPELQMPKKINLEIDVPKSVKQEAAKVKKKVDSAVKKTTK